jgi:hypothetical protein
MDIISFLGHFGLKGMNAVPRVRLGVGYEILFAQSSFLEEFLMAFLPG